MRIHLGVPTLGPAPLALTIGNFDGVHLGHQAMLHALRTAATALGYATGILTFEPHPREYFTPHDAPARLTPLRLKLELLSTMGLDHAIVLRFNRHLAAKPAAQFVQSTLVEQLGTRWLLVGDDFRFGASRQGDLNLLQNLGQTHGFECYALSSVMVEGQRVSSSAVREALDRSNLELARRLLGRPFSISARVIHGRKLGRTLGYPTANLGLQGRTPPINGIFAVSVHQSLNGPGWAGVANLGRRPTLDSPQDWLLEVHLFDRSPYLYGQRLQVRFHHKLRDEERFDSLEALTRQMGHDSGQARQFMAQHPHLLHEPLIDSLGQPPAESEATSFSGLARPAAPCP